MDFFSRISLTNETLAITGQCLKDSLFRGIEEFLYLFYILSPTESVKDDPYEVANYEIKILFALAALIVIDQIIRYFKDHDQTRFQDLVINSGSGLTLIVLRLFLTTAMIIVFMWIHSRMRIVDLPLHSIWTWLLSFLLVDFTYYWVHRSLHEINILWAAHQFHHMAEDMNVSASVRDSAVDLLLYTLYPLPLAIIIPPQVLMVHVQFHTFNQFWLHNEVIGRLGFIEYIINTPSQHRLHHGKNPYCIDKNYGGMLMIWDRLFGTHETEKEKIIYGAVSPVPHTYDVWTIQFCYYRDFWNKFKKVDGFANKLSAIFKGPGWSPGKPRLGNRSDIPEPDYSLPKYSHDTFVPTWKKAYIGYHGLTVILGFNILADHPFMRYSPFKGTIVLLYIIFVWTAFGTILDNRKCAPIIEIIRCLVYFPFDYFLIESVNWQIGPMQQLMLAATIWTVRVVHVLSILFWIGYWCVSEEVKEDESYGMAAKTDKDVESETSVMRRMTGYKTKFLLLGFLVMASTFAFAYTLRLDICNQMYNDWYYVFFK